jgi:hypothetical protein
MIERFMQDQKAGDNSFNVQAHEVTISSLTASEARQIALDVFNANALELAGIARDMFESRGREFIDHYLEELQRRKPVVLGSFADPDMQYALFTAQREYARSGRADLEKLLIDLLVERTTAADLRRIVLNEAIAVAPKLTQAQFDVLSLVLIFVHDAPLRYEFQTLEDFKHYLSRCIAPFLEQDLNNYANFMHLKYTGCASLHSGSIPFFHHIGMAFQGCLTKGFAPDFQMGLLSDLVIPILLKPRFGGSQPIQLKPMDSRTFDSRCRERGIPDEQIQDWHTRIEMTMFEVPDIAGALRELEPRFGNLWESGDGVSGAIEIELTSVGVALANANIRRKTGMEFDLGNWIG